MKKEFVIFILLITLISLTAAQNTSIRLSWDERDIYYGRDFDIKINIYNLENQTYDLKIWIESKDEATVLTEIYDNNEDKWKSGNYYINKFFEGPGNLSEDVELRIKEKYKDYEGDAYLRARLRDSSEFKIEIGILEPKPPPKLEQLAEPEQPAEPKQPTNQIEKIKPTIIQLSKPINQTNNSNKQQETIKTNNNIFYESKNQLIIKYSTFSFALSCVILSLLINWNRLK